MMQMPVIHLNGDLAETLANNYLDVKIAIQKAIEALHTASPNGRNYYPAGPEAMKTAVNEHFSRIERLQSVLSEIDELLEHCTAWIP